MSASIQIPNGFGSYAIGAVTMSFEVRGVGPVCLVHSGGPGLESSYLRIPEIEDFVTAVYVDPVGTGGSSRLPDGDYSVERYADLAYRLIEGALGGRAYFLGHSHGGFVGLQLALDHPEVLEGLIAYDSAPVSGADLAEEATQAMDRFVHRFPGDDQAADALAAWTRNLAGEESIDSAEGLLIYLRRLLPAYFADFRCGSVDVSGLADELAVSHDPNRLPDDWDVRDRLTLIAVATLVLVGRRDFICGPRWAAQIWQEVDESSLVTFDRSGHFAHLEEPARFANAIRRFVG